MLKTRVAFAVVIGLSLLASMAQAETIISDTFDGNWWNITRDGKHPNVPGASLTWSGSTGNGQGDIWGIDNNVGIFNNPTWLGNNQSDSIALPFVPATGKVYTLSVDEQTTSSGDAWAGLFFDNSSAGNKPGWSLSGAWMIATGGGGANAFFTDGGNLSGSSNGTGWNHLELVLDTTAAQWTATPSVNGVSLGTHTYSVNPTIHGVGITAFNANAKYDNFSLTAATAPVPEPSTLVLLASFGLVGLVSFLRRK